MQSSKIFRTLFQNLTSFDITFSNFVCFEPLAMFVANSNMVSHFLVNLEISGYEHSQLTDTKNLSHLLFLGFFTFFHKNIEQLVKNMFTYQFKDDSISNNIHILIWIVRIINKYNDSTFKLPSHIIKP